jgi:hypothetical protein
MLVWSEAWSAEGEKGKTSCSLKHTLARASVPTVFFAVTADGLQLELVQ